MINKSLLGSVSVILYCIAMATSSILVNKIESHMVPIYLAFLSFLFTALCFNLVNLHRLHLLKSMWTHHIKLTISINIATAILWLSLF